MALVGSLGLLVSLVVPLPLTGAVACLVVLVSDFLDDARPLALGMNRLRYDGHDVIVIHLADPHEQTFPFIGPSILEGHEQSGRLVCDPRDLREIYLEESRKAAI